MYHIGYGFDAAASSIVLLATLGQFGNSRKLDDNLDSAFHAFDAWCKTHRKFTAIDEFSKQAFAMGKNLGEYYLELST